MSDDRSRFENLVTDWIVTRSSPNTQAAYRSDLERFLQWWKLHRRRAPLTATPADVAQFEAACTDAGASQATVARRISALSSFFSFAATRGAVVGSPVQGTRRPPMTATPTADLSARQRDRLLRSIARIGDRATLLVGLILFDGLKLNEVLAADADDVTITEHGAVVIAIRSRGIPGLQLDPRTATAVASYLDGRTNGALILGESPARPSARLTRFGADYLLKRISADAGLEPAISANTLRRGYVANAVAGGASVESIRDHLGHIDIRTTRRHISGNQLV